MALKDKIPKIVQHINKYKSTVEYNYRLYAAYEGQIKEEILRSMAEEIISPTAYKRASQRIPSINILKKSIDKVSTVYAEPVKRLSESESDTSIMSNIVKHSMLDVTMLYADSMANLQKMAAIEPYVENGVQKFRVYGGHQFLPFGDDPLNPMKMTAFIKFMGKHHVTVNVGDDVNPVTGLRTEQPRTMVKEVNTYLVYSDDEILMIDEGGSIMDARQRELGVPTVNEFGIIPQTYINKSHFELVPFPETSHLDISILIPKLLADLNYSVQFQSHSIIYVKNVDMGNQEINPDTVIDLGERVEGGGEPEMGVIQPKVDIQGTLEMTEFQLNGYFSSIGIKTSSLNGLKPGREVSGIAKAIDEGDTTLVRRKNIEFFKNVESNLWEKMEVIQNKWVDMNILSKESRKFSSNLGESFTIIFGEVKVLESIQDKVMKVEAQERLGVITKDEIIKEFNPDFTEAQIQKRMGEVEKQQEEQMKRAMEQMDAATANFDSTNTNGVQLGPEAGNRGQDNRNDNSSDS